MTTLEDKLGTQKRFGFTSKVLPPGTFAVAELSGTEAISRPYEFELTLVSENPNLALETVLDQPATLTIHPRAGDPQPIPYHGLVKQLEQAHQVESYTFYRVLLAPRVWDLSLDRISEVYVDRTIPQILDLKLKENGLTSQDYELKLAGTYKLWPYVCQYQETDLAFITRLMERDGIYFYFEQGTDREKLSIIDAKAMQSASVQKVPYRPAAQMETGVSEESIQAWICRQKPVPRKVVLQDYNYRTASLALSAEADVVSSGKGEMRLYGEAFETQQEGKALAMIRAQELACRKKTFQGDGTATGLRAGFFMEVQGHYRTDFNGRYLVTEVRHEGGQAGTLLAGLEAGGATAGHAREDFYRNECAAMPADVQFRPERLTPKPVIHGTMTAFVDAEGSGQYAELDDQGRYKVQLPFDKTDKGAAKASAWIRMATPYSGKDHGMHFPLHKGAEVLLSFQDGDPNWPVITAAVPNSDNPNLVTRNNQTQSLIQTAGSNRIAFEDQENQEQIVMTTPSSGTRVRLGATNASDSDDTKHRKNEPTDGWDLYTEGTFSANVKGNYENYIGGILIENIVGGLMTNVAGGSMEFTAGGSTDIVLGETFYLWFPAVQFLHMGWTLELTKGLKTEIDTAKCVFCEDEMHVLENKIHVAESEIHTVNNNIQAIDSDIRALGSNIVAVDNKVEAANTWIHATDQELAACDQWIRTTQTTIEAHGQRIAAAETEIKTVETGISAMEMDMRNSGMAMTNTDLFIIS